MRNQQENNFECSELIPNQTKLENLKNLSLYGYRAFLIEFNMKSLRIWLWMDTAHFLLNPTRNQFEESFDCSELISHQIQWNQFEKSFDCSELISHTIQKENLENPAFVQVRGVGTCFCFSRYVRLYLQWSCYQVLDFACIYNGFSTHVLICLKSLRKQTRSSKEDIWIYSWLHESWSLRKWTRSSNQGIWIYSLSDLL